MTAITLHHIDTTRNMSRFYRLDLQPDLFGAWGVIREWGRIGQAGRVRIDPYPTAEQAEDRMHRQQAVKQGRGYTVAFRSTEKDDHDRQAADR